MPQRTERSLALEELEHRLVAHSLFASTEMVHEFIDSDEGTRTSSLHDSSASTEILPSSIDFDENGLSEDLTSSLHGSRSSIDRILSSIDSNEYTSIDSLYASDDEFLVDSESTIYNAILSQCYFSERHPDRVNSSLMANDILHINAARFKSRFRCQNRPSQEYGT